MLGCCFLILALIFARGSAYRQFVAGVVGTALILSLPPGQQFLSRLLKASTASRILLLIPAPLLGAMLLAERPRVADRLQWIAVIMVVLLGLNAARTTRWKLLKIAIPAHGFAWKDPRLTELVQGRTVLTDPWTSFTGRSYWKSYGVSYPVNHATTPDDSLTRRSQVQRLFATRFDPQLALELTQKYQVAYLLINHRYERGEVDSSFVQGVTIPMETLAEQGWKIVYRSSDLSLLQPPSSERLAALLDHADALSEPR